MKIGDFLIVLLILVWLYFSIRWIKKQRKKGGCFGCSGCDGKNCSGK